MAQLRHIIERRGRLRRRVLWWVVVALATGIAAASPGLVPALVPEPNPARVLFDELARTHYRATSTSTVVKQYPDLRRLFVAEYNKRNVHPGLAPVELPEPRGLWSYSYVPGGPDLTEHRFDELYASGDRPSMVVTEPSDPPFVVWIYSQEQNAVAVVFFERFVQDVFEGKPPSPDPRMLLDYDSAGAVASYGPVPKERLIHTHAWFLTLGDTTAHTIVYGATRPRADELDFIPFVVEASAREEFVPPVFSGAAVDRVRDEVRRPARYVRLAMLAATTVAAIAVVCAMLSLLRLRREVSVEAPIGFGAFLFGDLEAIVARRMHERRATTVALTAKRREQTERAELLDEIAALGEPPGEELSIAGLCELRDKLAAAAAARSDEQARVERVEQEGEREIHRLEVELGSLPVEASIDEEHAARQAWELLQQAIATSEPRRRVELLKKARRLLPREYRPERF